MDARATKLKAVIDAEPANATRTPAQILAWLHESVTAYQDVQWLDFQMWMSEYALRPTVESRIATGNDAQKTGARFMVDTIDSGQPLFSSDVRVRSVLAQALPGGDARTALLALATTTAPRWQVEGVFEGIVTEAHVAEVARA